MVSISIQACTVQVLVRYRDLQFGEILHIMAELTGQAFTYGLDPWPLDQLGVPQGQGDSSAPSTTDPLSCDFCLVTTPNTRGKTVEQSIVTWMFAREFITNCHPVVPQLTNKPCMNWRLTDGQSETNITPKNFVVRGFIKTVKMIINS